MCILGHKKQGRLKINLLNLLFLLHIAVATPYQDTTVSLLELMKGVLLILRGVTYTFQL